MNKKTKIAYVKWSEYKHYRRILQDKVRFIYHCYRTTYYTLVCKELKTILELESNAKKRYFNLLYRHQSEERLKGLIKLIRHHAGKLIESTLL